MVIYKILTGLFCLAPHIFAMGNLDNCFKPKCYNVADSERGKVDIINPKGSYTIFCFHGYKTWMVWMIFSTPTLTITTNTGKVSKSTYFETYEGHSVDNVEAICKQTTKIWKAYRAFMDLFSKSEHSDVSEIDYYFEPFNIRTCLLVDTDGDFEFSAREYMISYTHFLLFLIGIALFYFADILGESTILHYMSAGFLSAALSFYIPVCIYFHYFYTPKQNIKNKISAERNKRLALGCAGTSFALLVVLYLIPNWTWLALYLAFTTLIGTACIYRFYTISDIRTINIMCQAVRIVSLILIYFGIRQTALSVSVVIGLAVFYTYGAFSQFLVRRDFERMRKKNKGRAIERNGTLPIQQ